MSIPVTEEVVTKAKQFIDSGMSKRKAAEILGVEESTLRKRLKKGYGVSSLGRFRSTFDENQESELVNYCKDLDLRFYGITIKSLRHLSYQYAVKNNIRHRFNDHTEMAGIDWAQSFIKRHNLSLRTPQKTSVGRIMGFNRVQVEVFFTNLTDIMTKHKFSPSRVYNMDETGITTVPNRIPKVISVKGKRAVGKVVSAERGQTVTAVCCMSASGNYVPPTLIFPRKRDRPELMHGSPPDSIMFLSESGYINSSIFVEWLKHFQKYSQSSQDNPVLLILDNHSSHISLEAITFSKDHFIHLLSIPPHSSHKIQPLDRCFFKGFKDFYGQYVDQWMVNHPGRVIGQYQVAELFGNAYLKAATMEKAITAFKSCGIVPINRYIFSDEDFLPSSVTDQPQNSTIENSNMIENDSQTCQQIATRVAQEMNASVVTLDCYGPSTSSPNAEPSIVQVSPYDIVPLPTIGTARRRNKNGKKSTVLTSTPNKIQLELGNSRKIMIEEEKRAKRKLKFDKIIKTKVKKTKKLAGPTAGPSNVEDEHLMCPACEEKYEEPPEEDWIQCNNCGDWWHEKCSNYECGLFRCDYC